MIEQRSSVIASHSTGDDNPRADQSQCAQGVHSTVQPARRNSPDGRPKSRRDGKEVEDMTDAQFLETREDEEVTKW
ncbi:hypothetical protein GCM10010151_33670 [Actinoallomurus spadix]|uniref:Uncharacterized protein n=1 Tax=Actinoallomurus spadix TaxID=79912 RepID=A0ABP3GDX2_9ACTN